MILYPKMIRMLFHEDILTKGVFQLQVWWRAERNGVVDELHAARGQPVFALLAKRLVQTRGIAAPSAE